MKLPLFSARTFATCRAFPSTRIVAVRRVGRDRVRRQGAELIDTGVVAKLLTCWRRGLLPVAAAADNCLLRASEPRLRHHATVDKRATRPSRCGSLL